MVEIETKKHRDESTKRGGGAGAGQEGEGRVLQQQEAGGEGGEEGEKQLEPTSCCCHCE